MPPVGYQSALDQWFCKRNVTDPKQVFGAECARLLHQIPHEEVVALGLGVLKVRDGVHPGRKGELPSLLGEIDDRRERIVRENVAGMRRENSDIQLSTAFVCNSSRSPAVGRGTAAFPRHRRSTNHRRRGPDDVLQSTPLARAGRTRILDG